MSIIFNKKTREFHLFNEKISYILNIMQNEQLGHLYFGKKLRHRDDFSHLLQTIERPLTVCTKKDDAKFSLDYLPQEAPSYGTSDFREGVFQIRFANGSIVSNFVYADHKIVRGKPKLMDGVLPATYVEDDGEADTLEIRLVDELTKAEITLLYTIYSDHDAVVRSIKYSNLGSEAITLDRALSMGIDFRDMDFEMIQLSGAWSRERHLKNRKISNGVQSISSTRGASSANHNPFIALKRPDTTEHVGEVYGFSLVYSGNFLAQVEVNHYDTARVTMGINPFNFSWKLNKGESLQTPEVALVFSDQGMNGLSQTYHDLYRTRLVRGEWRDRSSSILINNWEATYFDFNEKKILDIAEKASTLGIELFVLDDGWFGRRNSDREALGDWFENREKLPAGLGKLAQKINEFGMKFGLWIEPEMISEDSELYKAHPDWAVSTPHRAKCYGRNQFVLDFSRREIVDHIYSKLEAILSSVHIEYVKWDMNRNITEPFSVSLAPEQQGEFMHRYILGVYDLYNRLTSKFPKILFESCASGGARFDPGMLYYAPQTWTSDNTDAVERLKIQYGTSMVYPIKAMGSHVSGVPNHQVGRSCSFKMRGDTAYFGTFGYELDVTRISEDECQEVTRQIEEFKKYQKIIHNGHFYRLMNPFENLSEDVLTAWMSVSKDRLQAVVGIYKVLANPNPRYEYVKLKGLDETKKYQLGEGGRISYGDELMYYGIPLSECFTGVGESLGEDHHNIKPGEKFGFGDFTSKVIHLKAVE